MMGCNASFLACACDRFEQVVKVQTEAWEARTYGYSVNNTLRNHQLVKPNSNRMLLSKAGAKKKFESTMTRAQDMVCELMVRAPNIILQNALVGSCVRLTQLLFVSSRRSTSCCHRSTTSTGYQRRSRCSQTRPCGTSSTISRSRSRI